MDNTEVCKHRWSTTKRIFISQSHWIEVQHCRKKCQRDRQVEFHTRMIKGKMVTESTITMIISEYSENDASNQQTIPDRVLNDNLNK